MVRWTPGARRLAPSLSPKARAMTDPTDNFDDRTADVPPAPDPTATAEVPPTQGRGPDVTAVEPADELPADTIDLPAAATPGGTIDLPACGGTLAFSTD